MKSKSIIGACVLAASVMAVTSCQDMFEIESNRVVYQEQHQLGSTAGRKSKERRLRESNYRAASTHKSTKERSFYALDAYARSWRRFDRFD